LPVPVSDLELEGRLLLSSGTLIVRIKKRISRAKEYSIHILSIRNPGETSKTVEKERAAEETAAKSEDKFKGGTAHR
jgi:hypothetical protein